MKTVITHTHAIGTPLTMIPAGTLMSRIGGVPGRGYVIMVSETAKTADRTFSGTVVSSEPDSIYTPGVTSKEWLMQYFTPFNGVVKMDQNL
jgi:hypothetical protein